MNPTDPGPPVDEEQPVKGAGDVESSTAVDEFATHLELALDEAQNMRWSDAKFHLEAAAVGTGATANSSLTPLYKPLYEFVIGNLLLVTAETEDDRNVVLSHLKAARAAARDNRVANPSLSKDANYLHFALGIQLQALGVEQRIARERGEEKEVLRLQAQIEQMFNEMLNSLAEDDPMRAYLVAMKATPIAMSKLQIGMVAAAEMNLDLAQRYLREASEGLASFKTLVNNPDNKSAMMQSVVSLYEGFRLFVGALDGYTSVLRQAIIGDVSKSDLQRLADTEQAALDGTELIVKSLSAMPGLFPALDLRPAGKSLATNARNLRALGERSLSPKEISRSASPRAVFYFLGTFAVLIFALPLSGLVQRINFAEIGILLVLSLIVSLIGTFGFESIRLTPWFDVLGRFMPGLSRRERATNTETATGSS